MDMTKVNAWLEACPAQTMNADDAAAAFAVLETEKCAVHFVCVAGTAGKTAVAAMEASILENAGFPCGVYRAGDEPLQKRISISGQPAAASAVETAVQKLGKAGKVFPRPAAELAIACHCFTAAGCAFAVTELEDTLLAQYLPDMPACAITQIGDDGTGRSLERAACVAASVMRKGSAAVTVPGQPKAALQELIVAAGKADSTMMVPEADDITDHKARRMENHFDYGGYEAELPVIGRPMQDNVAAAVELALALWRKGYEISDDAILSGIASVPAECGPHLLRRRPFVLADPCHKPVQAAVLADLLRKAELDHISVIIGLAGCEKPDAFFAALEQGFIPEDARSEKTQMPGMSDNAIDKVYLVTPDAKNAVRAEEALETAKFHFDAVICPDVEDAVKKARADANEGIVILGSKEICRQAEKHFAAKH